MSYQKYGIPSDLVHRIKTKLKNPSTKERIKQLVNGLTKYDLQDRIKVRKMVGQAAKYLHESFTEQQMDNIVNFVIAQKIDPSNTLHLIRLWSMFR